MLNKRRKCYRFPLLKEETLFLTNENQTHLSKISFGVVMLQKIAIRPNARNDIKPFLTLLISLHIK